ncbi:MAG: ABC transporter ATP-binding protein [Bacteroidetes bacterium]|nr:ABC transporter ATP-binding protein [Bacteroidota bacterium]
MSENIIELKNVTLVYQTRLAFFRHKKIRALDNINFSVKRGETFGIVGDNGCGKSTLLKVLAGIYQPDSGRVIKRCSRISLLTIGLGFDKELTGRDNAMISSMLLGASRKDALASLNKIVEFSELGEFIEQPVKVYSSGMRARLGFAIAITMDVELLLIDEALGVGDTKFRKKAEKVMLNKINSDQTVIFVSHSETQVKNLCKRALWLEKGQVKMVDDIHNLYAQYNN